MKRSTARSQTSSIYARPFGCLASVTWPHELRQKLITQTAAYKAILLGYTESTHQYRVRNIRSGYIQLVRDVTFNENVFPAANAFSMIFPYKPLPSVLQMDKNDQSKSLDSVRNAIQPSLEPENDSIIDRQLDATPVRGVELQYTETSGTQIEPELDFEEQMDITAELSEP
jgi:hypothetical protein